MTSNQPQHRRGTLRITSDDLHALLNVPDGLRIVDVYRRHNPAATMVVLEGDALTPIREDEEAPSLDGSVHLQQYPDPAGGTYYRPVWDLDDDDEDDDDRLREFAYAARQCAASAQYMLRPEQSAADLPQVRSLLERIIEMADDSTD